MKEPIPYNNEFVAAELALRKGGSNLWFSGLSEEWQEVLVTNTVETFDSYQLTMDEAAGNMIRIYQEIVAKNPVVMDQNPWKVIVPGE
ncbi:hypothetical protein [Marinobacter sp.]|uniref:hypothetical protein n=1 Tax=Marinobacter sp. TaxID=50741 RepID=UPI003A94ECF5